MSAEKRQWTEAEKHAASKLISERASAIWSAGGIGDEAADRLAVLELQCEHTALYEALDRLVREHSMAFPVRRDALNNARAALSAAQKGTHA